MTEKSTLVQRVESMQGVYIDILETIAAKIKEHGLVVERDTMNYFDDIVTGLVADQVRRERKLLSDFGIEVDPWPEDNGDFIKNLNKGFL